MRKVVQQRARPWLAYHRASNPSDVVYRAGPVVRRTATREGMRAAMQCGWREFCQVKGRLKHTAALDARQPQGYVMVVLYRCAGEAVGCVVSYKGCL
jgi:hypothetical protein